MNELIPPRKPLPDKQSAEVIRTEAAWHYTDRNPSPSRVVLFFIGLAALLVAAGFFVTVAMAKSL